MNIIFERVCYSILYIFTPRISNSTCAYCYLSFQFVWAKFCKLLIFRFQMLNTIENWYAYKLLLLKEFKPKWILKFIIYFTIRNSYCHYQRIWLYYLLDERTMKLIGISTRIILILFLDSIRQLSNFSLYRWTIQVECNNSVSMNLRKYTYCL